MTAIDDFLEHLSASCADDSFVRLVLSGPLAAGAAVQNVQVRRVDLKGVPHLSFTLREARRDTTRNLPVQDAIAWVRDRLGGWRAALLETTRRSWQLQVSKQGRARLVVHRAAAREAPPRTHDRPSKAVLDASANDWLAGLGLVDAAGRARPGMSRKRQQVVRYVEILDHLVRDCGWATPGDAITVVDVGCGRGPLTFGAWHLLHRVHHRAARVVGVESRGELVERADALARQVAADGLEFMTGDVDTVALPRADLLIALHACDTATDHAIRRGVESNATLIVVAPCCHQELRPKLGRPSPLAPILAHGLMAERLAEWVTDGLRALTLEWAGYRTRLIEFVASEHTPKNLLIAAIRDPARAPFADAGARAAIDDLRRAFELDRCALDALLERRA